MSHHKLQFAHAYGAHLDLLFNLLLSSLEHIISGCCNWQLTAMFKSGVSTDPGILKDIGYKK